MPDHVPRYDFMNSWPTKNAMAGDETAHFTIKLQDATVGRARAMTEGTGAFGVVRPGSPVVGHELTHTVQPPPRTAAQPQKEVAFVFHKITWDLGPGLPPDIALRTRSGQLVQVIAKGRTAIEGRLKSVARHGHSGEDWTVTLTGVRRL